MIRYYLLRAVMMFWRRHRYLSTSCLHDDHMFCKIDTTRYDGTHRHGSHCKFCDAECLCWCHKR